MKIMLICSTSCYDKVAGVKEELESMGHSVIVPNSYDAPVTNDDNKEMSEEEYLEFFKTMFYMSRDKIKDVDAVVVLNYDKVKNGKTLSNYIGASTFLEMYEAFMNNKKIFMMNGYPDNLLYDEIKGFGPIIINEDLSKVK